MHGCNKKIIALTDQLSRLNLLTHLDNGLANPIPILTQGKNYPFGKGSVLYCRITDFLRREGDTAKGWTPLKDVLRPIAYLLLWIVGITKKNKV
jgi:hypothetical protein